MRFRYLSIAFLLIACGALVYIDKTAPSAMQKIKYMVPMRDGIKLETIIYKTNAAPSAVVLSRGYSAGGEDLAKRFNEAGYTFVSQATRGHGNSEGELNRFFNDADDGYDTLSWIAKQRWSDGNIAMFGVSYWAATQWLVAPLNHPNLKAIIPQNISADLWQHSYWSNGALSLAMTADGRAYGDKTREKIKKTGWEKFYRTLPLIDLDKKFSGYENKLWNDYISHSRFDDFWKEISLREKIKQIKIPVYLMSGWYDYYPGAAFESFSRLREQGYSSEIRIAVGPSDHVNRIAAERPFGAKAEKDEVLLALRWLDYVIKGIDKEVSQEPPVKIFVMGENKWRFENDWPLTGTKFTKYFLSAEEGSRFGALSKDIRSSRPSKYLYDPNDPVPTLGGNHSFLGEDHPELIKVGAFDQRPNEKRKDVLVFSTQPLVKDTEVTGPVMLKIYASTSARDTDFTAKLIDVYPDGTAYNLTEGILRARFRKSIWEKPELLEAGRIYEFNIKLLPTSNLFKKGHRIRIHLTSSNFPLWDRNPNTGNRQGMDADLEVAQQTVFHDNNYPSHVLLPVIERRRD